jgi:hypothetical protein
VVAGPQAANEAVPKHGHGLGRKCWDLARDKALFEAYNTTVDATAMSGCFRVHRITLEVANQKPKALEETRRVSKMNRRLVAEYLDIAATSEKPVTPC